jgi:NADPH2:quinone reductase
MMRQGGAKPPYIPGLDCVGTVIAVGSNVRSFRVGQRVAAFADGGSYAEVVLAKESLAFAVPDGAKDEAVSSILVLVTAWNLVQLAGRLAEGESVLVHSAAGGVGSTAIQLARAFGAKKIFGTVSDAAKKSFALDCGADEVFELRDFVAATKEATGGRGVDLILDSTAGEVFGDSLGVLAPFGRIVVYGQASGSPGTVRTDQLVGTDRSVIGYSSGHYRGNRPEAVRLAGEGALQMAAKGKIQLKVGARYPLHDAAEAHQLIESRKSCGKILLIPS